MYAAGLGFTIAATALRFYASWEPPQTVVISDGRPHSGADYRTFIPAVTPPVVTSGVRG